jgi:hypothetical protein
MDWDDKDQAGRAVLAAQRVDGPPQAPWKADRAYPLALDINAADGIAAVSFAILDMYPDIEPGWWCEAVTYSLRDGEWCYAAGESDNNTAPNPFSRPDTTTNSIHDWCDWHSNGGLGGWGQNDTPEWRHTFFGIAPTGTTRMTVTDETGHTRDLQITPWNGAYVAIVAGAHSTLTGYDDRGQIRGSFKAMDGLPEDPEPAPRPGWERVEGLGNEWSEPEVFRRVDPSGDG